jgi:hypothetical protein
VVWDFYDKSLEDIKRYIDSSLWFNIVLWIVMETKQWLPMISYT